METEVHDPSASFDLQKKRGCHNQRKLLNVA